MLDTLTTDELYRLKVRMIKSKNQQSYEYIYKVIDHKIILRMIERSKAHGTI